MKKLFIILLAVILFFSCNRVGERGNVTITGLFPALAGKSIYLEELQIHSKLKLDSAEIKGNGKVEFNLRIDEPGFYVLRTNEQNYVLLQLEKDEKLNIHSDYAQFAKGYTVSGSPGSELLREFDLFMNRQKQKVDSLGSIYYSFKDQPDFYLKKLELDSAYKTIYDNQKKYVENFIDQHPGSLASLIVINRKLGMNSVLDEDSDFIFFHRLDSALMLKYPNNSHVVDNHKRVEEVGAAFTTVLWPTEN